MKIVTFLIPCYNEESVIDIFFQKLLEFINEKKLEVRYSIRIVFLNNGSTDNTLSKIIALKEKNSNLISYQSLIKNFGYQNNLMSGLENIKSDYYIILDCDGEEPLHMIENFLAKADNGYDWVYGIRKYRSEHFAFQILRKFLYRVASISADHNLKKDVAEFGLINLDLRNKVIKIKSSFIFLRYFFSCLSAKSIGIEYKRETRLAGNSNYNFLSFITFAIVSYLSTTTFPLRLISYFGLILIIVNIFFVLNYLSLKIMIFLNLSFIIFSFTSIALYAARIYKSVNKLPNYIIDKNNTNLT